MYQWFRKSKTKIESQPPVNIKNPSNPKQKSEKCLHLYPSLGQFNGRTTKEKKPKLKYI